MPQRKGGRRKNRDSGFTTGVSDASWFRLASQVRDAEQFLVTHRSELARLARCPGLEYLVLDFPVNLRIGKRARGSSL